ncbi:MULTISPECIES: aldolase/citrate lyase family protein [unclassified Leptolyngbya]|uniref:aldolase/citrate lyase family protein n=1 Tax=unclassified Leptolyngbya TaxID=2650499 RepID=UPI0016829B37|nr:MULTISPECIES: aldolase/citrate lyase family protein [unclassified Leptolyngbya]MBD1911021.1 citrate lyase beta subunit [Leptolyngbya sp. FACHB-8]MBD2158313.1 citrate lyase beta subunit [Leptolyngbya sp. FACHB-16]
MNKLERQIVSSLQELKEYFGVFEIKAEFEAEGTRLEELLRLRDVTATAGLPIILKIGGVEAITDIHHGLTVGVKGIVAPMVESSYALSKFLGVIESFVPPDVLEDMEFAFNLETITAYQNLDEFLSLPNLHLLSGVTFGRVDFTGSMGYSRAYADGDEILEVCQKTFRAIKKQGLKTALGGAISTQSRSFIKALHQENLIDKFETRKVVFKPEAIENAEVAIQKAVAFELLWLKNKANYYNIMAQEDLFRIQMLEKRLM